MPRAGSSFDHLRLHVAPVFANLGIPSVKEFPANGFLNRCCSFDARLESMLLKRTPSKSFFDSIGHTGKAQADFVCNSGEGQTQIPHLNSVS
jgi:hypothetical protein